MLRQPFKSGSLPGRSVIPEKAGIQQYQIVPDTNFHRYDDLA